MSNKTTLKELEEKPYLICKVEDPTEEMIRAALKNSNYILGKIKNPTAAILIEEFEKANCYLKDVEKPLPNIPEDVAIKATKNVGNLDWIQAFCFIQDVFLKHVHMTKAIAKELLITEPGYGQYDEVKAVIDNELERIAVHSFLEKMDKMKTEGKEEYEICRWRFPDNIPLTEDDYKYLTDNHLEGYAFHFISKREDTPLELRKIYLEKSECNLSFIHIDDDIIDYYFELHPDCNYLPREFVYQDLCHVVEKHSWIIKLISKPSAAEREAAIRHDPMNIQYIKNPSEKDCLNALKANPGVSKYIKKRTKRICEALGIAYGKKEVNKYPDEFYYVSIRENLADEGYLGRNIIVKGSDMAKFLSRKVRISFGNLEDDRYRKLKDIANFKPITKEEIETLKKFGVDNIEFGYWNFS